jgi:hypothetical protein
MMMASAFMTPGSLLALGGAIECHHVPLTPGQGGQYPFAGDRLALNSIFEIAV